MCPKPFSWAKNKRELFSDEKSRGPLIARAALNYDFASVKLCNMNGVNERPFPKYIKDVPVT